jgi:hypothetical protein
LLLSQITAAQQRLSVQGGSFGASGVQRQYVSPWSGSMRWLRMPAIQKDLELVDDQIEKINGLQQEVQEKMRDFYKEYRELDPAERQKKYYEMNAELAEEVEEKIKQIILPEQQDRLKQVGLQMRLRSHWALGQQLTSDDLAEELDLSKRQKEKLLEVQNEVRQEYQQKMREIQTQLAAEAQKKILDVLTAPQQKKLEQLKGEELDWPTYPYGQGGGQKKPQ